MSVLREMTTSSLGGGKNILPMVGGGLALVGTATKTIKSIHWVPQGCSAIRLRNQKATVDGTLEGEMYSDLVKPGLRGSLPFWRSMLIVSHQDRTTDLQGLELDSAEGLQLKVDASILWAVPREKRAALRAHFGTEGGIHGTEERLRRVGRAGIREVMDGKSLHEIKDKTYIQTGLRTVFEAPFAECGVEFKGAMLEVATQTASDRLAQAINQVHIPNAEQIAEELARYSQSVPNPLRAIDGEGAGA